MHVRRRRELSGAERRARGERHARLLVGTALHGKALRFPSRETVLQHPHARRVVPVVDELGRQTGGALVVDSGSVEDEEFVAGQLAFSLRVLAPRIEVVARDVRAAVRDRAAHVDDEDRLAALAPLPRVPRADARQSQELGIAVLLQRALAYRARIAARVVQ